MAVNSFPHGIGHGGNLCFLTRKLAPRLKILISKAPEYAIMKSHVIKGAEILKEFTLLENISEGALYHHERYDGTGYIFGLKGDEIPLNARIIGLADTFDAMTANRVYRQQLNLDIVIDEIKRYSGSQFDPKLVKILLQLLDEKVIDINL